MHDGRPLALANPHGLVRAAINLYLSATPCTSWSRRANPVFCAKVSATDTLAVLAAMTSMTNVYPHTHVRHQRPTTTSSFFSWGKSVETLITSAAHTCMLRSSRVVSLRQDAALCFKIAFIACW